MVRTQIYLTDEERDGLGAVAKATDRTLAEIIREAVDRFLDLTRGDRRASILDEAAGMWKNRRDLPDFAAARRSWDRS